MDMPFGEKKESFLFYQKQALLRYQIQMISGLLNFLFSLKSNRQGSF